MQTSRGASAALWPSIVPFAIGLGSFALSSRLKFGDWHNPGPGLWPMCISVFILLVSAALFVSAWVKIRADRPAADDMERFTRSSRYPFYAMLALAAFIPLFDWFGLSLPCLALLLFWTRLLGRERWRVALPVSLGLTIFLYVIFGWGLGVPFPDDVLLLSAR